MLETEFELKNVVVWVPDWQPDHRRQEYDPGLYLTQLLANPPATPKGQLRPRRSGKLPEAWKHRKKGAKGQLGQLAENKNVLLRQQKYRMLSHACLLSKFGNNRVDAARHADTVQVVPLQSG